MTARQGIIVKSELVLPGAMMKNCTH